MYVCTLSEKKVCNMSIFRESHVWNICIPKLKKVFFFFNKMDVSTCQRKKRKEDVSENVFLITNILPCWLNQSADLPFFDWKVIATRRMEHKNIVRTSFCIFISWSHKTFPWIHVCRKYALSLKFACLILLFFSFWFHQKMNSPQNYT